MLKLTTGPVSPAGSKFLSTPLTKIIHHYSHHVSDSSHEESAFEPGNSIALVAWLWWVPGRRATTFLQADAGGSSAPGWGMHIVWTVGTLSGKFKSFEEGILLVTDWISSLWIQWTSVKFTTPRLIHSSRRVKPMAVRWIGRWQRNACHHSWCPKMIRAWLVRLPS